MTTTMSQTREHLEWEAFQMVSNLGPEDLTTLELAALIGFSMPHMLDGSSPRRRETGHFSGSCQKRWRGRNERTGTGFIASDKNPGGRGDGRSCGWYRWCGPDASTDTGIRHTDAYGADGRGPAKPAADLRRPAAGLRRELEPRHGNLGLPGNLNGLTAV
jgi:hypothetical protein